MGWRVATQLYDGHRSSSGTLGGTWDTWQLVGHQDTNHHLGGHKCHLVYCVTSAPGGGGTSCNVSFLIQFPQILRAISTREGMLDLTIFASFVFYVYNICYICAGTNNVLLLIPTSFKIVASIVVTTINWQ